MKKHFYLSLLLCLTIFSGSELQAQSGNKAKNIADMAVVYVEMNPKLIPTASESKRGFIAYPSSSLKMSFQYSRPDSTRLTSINVFAAQGEVIPVTFCIYALRDMEGVKLELSDLKKKNGAIIPAKCLTSNIVIHLSKRFMYQKTQHLINAPAYITPLENPVSIKADRSEKFWINFQSPINAGPGVYSGTITIRSKNTFQKIPLNIRILPFKLPEPKGLMYGMYYSNYGQVFGRLKTVDAMRIQVQHDLKDMRQHGMTSIGICNGVEPSSYTVTKEGDVKFNFTGNTLFELVMEAYKENNFTEPVVDMSKAGQIAAKDYKFGTSEYDSVYVRFYKGLAKEAKLKGWPVMYIQPFDEPGWHSQQERDDNLHLLKVLHAAGIPTEEDGPGDNYFVNIAGPYANLWNYNAALSSAGDVRHAQAENRKVTLYNYDVSGWLSECGRWACGLFNWKFGLNGTFNWIYFGGRGDLYNDLDGNFGDWMHYYPKTDNQPGGVSIGFEGIRQGINDRYYLELCQQIIQKAKAKGGSAKQAAEATEKMLDELRASLSDNLAAQYKNMDWTIYLTENEAKKYTFMQPEGKILSYVSGDYKYSNNLKLEDYDQIRWMIAANIVNLLEKSGDIPPTGIKIPPTVRISKKIPKPNFAQKTIEIPDLKNTPVIDGTMTPNEWVGATEIKLTLNEFAGDPQMPTNVSFGLKDDYFYVAFVCTEEVIDYLTMDATEKKGTVTSDDCVEVFLDPGLTQTKFYHIAINPRGVFTTDGSYGQWNSGVKVAASINRDKQEWLVELVIPIADMKLAPQFGLNFNRERRPKDALLELSSWVMTRGGFARLERFGTAVIK